MTQQGREAPLVEHLEELRLRIMFALGYWMIGAIVAWMYRGPLLQWLQYPLQFAKSKVQLSAFDLTEQLFVSMSIALWGGLMLALPFILHQLWLFITPGLYPKERRWAVPFILGAGLSFGLGAFFAYQVILPAAVPFLVDFLDTRTVIVNLGIGKYMSQVLTYLVTFGLLFELPILAFLLTKLGFISAKMLVAVRRYAIVVILVISAIITPTADPFNLLLMAGPLYLLYELGILVSRLAATPLKDAEHSSLE